MVSQPGVVLKPLCIGGLLHFPPQCFDGVAAVKCVRELATIAVYIVEGFIELDVKCAIGRCHDNLIALLCCMMRNIQVALRPYIGHSIDFRVSGDMENVRSVCVLLVILPGVDHKG